MKSNAPWSVKGIERDARAAAKEAARREGMTVGEWLNQVIYAAGEPASSDGEIEGLKTSDLVKAIEHLNKRVIHAESKGVAALDDFTRNFAGVVERVQRLERIKPGAGGSDLDDRLQRIEEKLFDRQRIDALRALEKAVSQAALQFDAAHRSSAARIEATEKQMQELASRLDLVNAVAESGEGSGAPVGYLKDVLDDLSDRIERVAAKAGEASPAADGGEPDFAERTGARLRVLGDEIKRGGDQVRSLESAIGKLSEQIDAAERRSAEGVQKAAEAISDLTAQFTQTEASAAAEARQQIEAAITAATERAEERILALEQSFEAAIARRELSGGAPLMQATPSFGSDEEKTRDADIAARDDEARVEDASAPDATIDIEFEAEPFDFDDDASADADIGRNGDSGASGDNHDDDELAFDLDRDDPPAPDEPENILDEVKDGLEDAPRDDDQISGPAGEIAPPDGLDAILAELDGFSGADEPAETAGNNQPVAALRADGSAERGGDAPTSKDLVNEARPAAIEAPAGPAPHSETSVTTRRKLTPKQRAILAAKIRRKRLAEQTETPDHAPEPEAASIIATKPPPETSASEDEPERPSLFAQAATALKGLQTRFRGGENDEPANNDDDAMARQAEHSEIDDNPNIAKAARSALRRVRAKPITIALGAAIVLAAAAVYFLAKDLMFAHAPATTNAAGAQGAGSPLKPSESLQSADAPPIQPRDLYFESVAQLKAATSDAEMRAAIGSLERAAALGHPPAQLQLGELYKLGQGAPQDAAQARALYERAANGGNVLAMHRMGVMAARGQGGPADQTVAISWFEQAGNYGLVDSQYNLGALYHPGGDGPQSGVQDAAKAYYWYALAAKNGDEQAGALADGLAAGLSDARRKAIDAEVANWTAITPDLSANEIAPAS